jgi:hypothetical protein
LFFIIKIKEEKNELEKNQQVEDDPKRKLYFELQSKTQILNAEIAQSEQKIKDSKFLISKLIPRLEVFCFFLFFIILGTFWIN